MVTTLARARHLSWAATSFVHKGSDGNLAATLNRCRHRYGRFRPGADPILTCSNHGWRLDVSTMHYVEPHQLPQDQLVIERDDDGTLRLYDVQPVQPWDSDLSHPAPLKAGEFTIRFYAHACVEICCGTRSLFTDPWLVGPAFTRGWWLIHHPPEDWLDRLASADAIYVSHNHSDHLNHHTLRLLSQRNPDVPILVPSFDGGSCLREISRLNFNNVSAVDFGVWNPLGPDARFMLLRDAAGRDDSGLLLDYKGHLVLNNVDCSNLNDGVLPNPVDALLTNFASGASGYPVCWEALYSRDTINRKIATNSYSAMQLALMRGQQTGARVVIPFAGYFTEAHPADRKVRFMNRKNAPEEVVALIRERAPGTHLGPAAG